MSRHTMWLTAALTLAVGVSLSADRVRLRSGKVVVGTFIGADSKAVRVLLDDGRVSEIPIQDAMAVEFSARKPATPPAKPAPKAAPAPAAQPAPKQEPAPLVVPSGTRINVRLTQPIDVDISVRRPELQGRRRRSRHAQRRHRHPARRRGRAPGRRRQAVGDDEGQRQDFIEAPLDRLRRLRLRGVERLRRKQGERRGQEVGAEGRRRRRPRRHRRRHRRRR